MRCYLMRNGHIAAVRRAMTSSTIAASKSRWMRSGSGMEGDGAWRMNAREASRCRQQRVT